MNKLKELHKQLKEMFVPEGSQHSKVGTLIQSDFIGSVIVITRFINDEHWYFKKVEMADKSAYGREMKAGSKYTYFVRNDKIVEEVNHEEK